MLLVTDVSVASWVSLLNIINIVSSINLHQDTLPLFSLDSPKVHTCKVILIKAVLYQHWQTPYVSHHLNHNRHILEKWVFSSDFCSSRAGFYMQLVNTSFTHSFQCSFCICHCNLIFIALCGTAPNSGNCAMLFQHSSASGIFHIWSCSQGFLHNCFKDIITEFNYSFILVYFHLKN